jgi:hypothetical protein
MNLPERATRTYIAVGLGTLLLLGVSLFMKTHGNLILAVIPIMFGALGLIGRYTLFPFMAIISSCYVIMFPMGIPRFPQREFIANSHLRVMDLVFVASVLIYLVTVYRLLSLRNRAMPVETSSATRHPAEPPITRPESLVRDDELPFTLMQIGGCVVIGQLLWFLLSEMRAIPSEFPPLKFASTLVLTFQPDAASSFLLCTLLFTLTFAVALLVMWYWRWSHLNPLEARQFLLNTIWSETRREMNRQEAWRAWAMPKLPSSALPKERSGCGLFTLRSLLLFMAIVIIAVVGWLIMFLGLYFTGRI